MLEVNNFNAIRISLASPDQIREWSKGEVTKPETINYRTLKPEKDGLFDERIFGPTKDWECYCGKYKRIRYKGIICDKCGVEVTRSKVRRERMGHIQLASPVSHIWYFKGTPSRLGILLDISPRNLERILYFALYIVTGVDEDVRKRFAAQIEEEAAGRGGKSGERLGELEDELRADIDRNKDELTAQLAATKAELESQRANQTEQIAAAAQVVEARLAELKAGTAEETIVFVPTGEVIVAAGDKGGKVATARLRSVVSAETERANETIQSRERDEALAVDQKVADLRAAMDETLRAEKDKLKEQAQGLKEDLRKLRDELEAIKPMMTIGETELRALDEKFNQAGRGRLFTAGMGAEAVRDIITRMDLETLGRALHIEVRTSSGQRRKKAIKRLRLIEAFRRSGTRPEWMILSVLPVIPPDLRPMVQLDGGRFATSDLNDLYRRVINRNNRLKRLLELGAPEIIIRNEKRMLQEACDALIDNGRRGRAIAGTGNHRLKSLSDMLKGKQGRFRQNLLGKRVDYSGRSVIVAGPELKLHQAGIPKTMALELFKPFVMSRLVERRQVQNIKAAKKIVESESPEVWDILEEVITEHPILLNRAPTLHRLGIQAFEPVLIEGKAIQLHPLVCTAFNADFDGDQMAVHLPLSVEAQSEARILMLSSNNILSPAHGKPLSVPSQDMILGVYYMTYYEPLEGQPELESVDVTDPEALHSLDPRPSAFSEVSELEHAYLDHVVGLQDPILLRWQGGRIMTTVGRALFNSAVVASLAEYFGEAWDTGEDGEPGRKYEYEYRNRVFTKKVMTDFVSDLVETFGATAVANLLDVLKDLGFHYATVAGVTISKNDIVVPPEKEQILQGYEEKVARIQKEYMRGHLTEVERRERVTDLWTEATDKVAEAMEQNFRRLNPVYMMANSGARGSFKQIRQLAGMRGLMANPKGEIIERPIKANFMEGLSVLEYFISTHGARKGLADTALRTADSGYLTRRLVDVAQDVVIRDVDCGTSESIVLPYRRDDKSEHLLGRLFGENIVDPDTGEVLRQRNDVITKRALRDLDKVFAAAEHKDMKLKVRSVLVCESEFGVCQHCYGRSLATNELAAIGEAVGHVAAQSIGEPGTQLTMRTFHTGGVAGADITHGLPRVVELFEARKPKGQARIVDAELLPDREYFAEFDDPANPRRIHIVDDLGEEATSYPVSRRMQLTVKHGDRVYAGDQLYAGPLNPHDLLQHRGPLGTSQYLVGEVQKVYKSQGVEISDKHIELIARQMTKRVRVDASGDTHFLPGQTVDKIAFERENAAVVEAGLEPATYEVMIMGITKASLATESFLSAASFQETTKVLTDAALEGKTDYLRGLKENVIIGKLIPAATGLRRYRNIEVNPVRTILPDIEGFFGVSAGQGDGGHVGKLTPEQASAMLSGDGGAGDEWTDASVDDLDLPTYVHSILTGYGIESIGALLDTTSEELLSISGFGQKSLEEVRNRLADRGLSLKGEEADEVEAVLSSDMEDD